MKIRRVVKTEVEDLRLKNQILLAMAEKSRSARSVYTALEISSAYWYAALNGEEVVSIELLRRIEEELGIDLGVEL